MKYTPTDFGDADKHSDADWLVKIETNRTEGFCRLYFFGIPSSVDRLYNKKIIYYRAATFFCSDLFQIHINSI